MTRPTVGGPTAASTQCFGCKRRRGEKRRDYFGSGSGSPGSASAGAPCSACLGQTLEPLYGFRSLESFKAKFKPRDVPLYLVFPDEAALPRIGLALTEAFLPGTPLPKVALAGVQGLRESR